MPILPKRYVKVSKGFGVWVSNYYYPNAFGVRGRYSATYKLGQYYEDGTPGTGFFAKTTSSHSYRGFLKMVKGRQKGNWWKMVTGRQFSFKREKKRAEKALAAATDQSKQRILESYINVLDMAAEAENLERLIMAVKNQSRHGRLGRYQTGLLTSYKSRLARLAHDVRFIQISVQKECGEEKYNQFAEVVEAFAKASVSHRIWHMDESHGGVAAHQVFFDLGIFDFIQSAMMTPMMRDSQGIKYFLYPDYLVEARSSVDFDIHPLKSTPFIFREIPYDQVLEAMSPSDYAAYQSRHRHKHHPAVNDPDGNLLNPANGRMAEEEATEKVRMRVVGELYMPTLKQRFCSQDIASMREFVQKINDYRGELNADGE